MIFQDIMPALHKANDDISVFGIENIDERAAKATYEELIKAQMVIYEKFIKPYAERLSLLERQSEQRTEGNPIP